MVAPFQQGELDGFCAIYASINAAKLITGRPGNMKGVNYLIWSSFS